MYATILHSQSLIRRFFIRLFLLVLSFYLLTGLAAQAQSVSSDKDDYAPGEIAIITGAGWLQDDSVDVHIEEEPAIDHHHDFHGTTVNTDGTWRIEYPIEDRHLGVAFTVIVKGLTSGIDATTTFTDAPSLENVTPSSGPVSGNTEVTITGRGLFVNGWDLVVKIGNMTASEKPGSRVIEGKGGNQTQSVVVYSPAQQAGTYEVKAVMTKTTGQQQTEESNALFFSYFKLPASLSLSNLSHTYDGNAKSALVTTTPSGLGGVAVTYNGSTTVPTAAGTYEVFASMNDVNYESAPIQGTLVIEKAAAYITLSGLQHTYNGYAKPATAATTATGSSSFIITYDGAVDPPVDHKASGYAVVARLENDNYYGSAAATLFIDKAEQIVSWASPAAITYGTPLSASQLNASLTTGEGGFTYSPSIGTVLNAGENQTLRVTAAETNNYNAAQALVFLDVAKATPAVSLAVGGPYTYDGQPKYVSNATVSGINGSTLGSATVSYKKNGSPVAAPTGAGTYEVLALFNGDANYTQVQEVGMLVINKAFMVIKAADAARNYGDSNPNLTAFIESGAVPGESFNLLASCSATEYSNVGSYTVVPSISGATLDNYELTASNGILTIHARPVTLTADAGQSKVYGDQDPALLFRVTAGQVVNNDSFSGNLARVAGEHTGNYVFTLGSLSLGGNYDLSLASGGLFTITPRPLTVAADAQTKVYGDSDPQLAYRVTVGALVTGDHMEGVLSRVGGEKVGLYGIEQNTLSAGSDYTLTFVGANLSITPAPLTVTAFNATRLCGQENPAYSGSISGIKNNDVITATYSTQADRSSVVGSYIIVPTLAGDALSNYTVTTVNGVMDVEGVLMDASINAAPQAMKSTATEIRVNVTNSIGGAAPNVPVTLYFDGNAAVVTLTNASGIASFNVGVLPAGVYKIRAVAGAGCDETVVYLPVYDPEGGFVTGGGWINSPKGAYKANPELTGKANFGFVAKYKKGSNIPDGNTEFQFQAGNLNFNSAAYDEMRLVISGAKATYKGVGQINGAGKYGFMVSAIDGDLNGGGGMDKFRIRIWTLGNEEEVIYDNNLGNTDENADPATLLGGGSIVIHENKTISGGSSSKKTVAVEAVLPTGETRFLNYPNPYNGRTVITFSLDKEEGFELQVYDVKGASVKKYEMGVAEKGKLYEYEFSSGNLPEGVYFARLVTSSGVKTIKMVLKR